MYSVIKFQAPFERLKLYQKSADISLRKAIITQAIIDATNISEDPQAKKLANDAKDWIFSDNYDFHMICIEAELEPSFVVKLTKEIIQLHINQTNNKKTQSVNTSNINPSETKIERLYKYKAVG